MASNISHLHCTVNLKNMKEVSGTRDTEGLTVISTTEHLSGAWSRQDAKFNFAATFSLSESKENT